MLKNKFYKNLFQILSFFTALVVLILILVIAFIESLKYKSDFGWILLVVSLCLIALFFLIGFYWIFQKVIIDEKGIKIVFLNKSIKSYKWEEIATIEETNIMRNPAIKVKLLNNSEIHLDKRKSIIKAIENYWEKI